MSAMFERMRYALSRSHSAECVMPYSSRTASDRSLRARSMRTSHSRKIGSSGRDRVDDSSSCEVANSAAQSGKLAAVVGSRRCPAVSVEAAKPGPGRIAKTDGCLLYTSDAADEEDSVDI